MTIDEGMSKSEAAPRPTKTDLRCQPPGRHLPPDARGCATSESEAALLLGQPEPDLRVLDEAGEKSESPPPPVHHH